MKRFVSCCLVLLLWPSPGGAQESRFHLFLNVSTQSADETVQIYRGLMGDPGQVASLRGSRLALATTAMLVHRNLDPAALEKSLQSAKFNQDLGDDVFMMKKARRDASAIGDLLDAIRRRGFAQRVVSTVEQLFPPETRIDATVPVYFVAFGPRYIDAYVVRAVWTGSVPTLVGEGQGEPTIVVNLARSVESGGTVDEQFVGMMSDVAHEVFHAAFAVYKDTSPFWRMYNATHRAPLDGLLDITQNEGIAYYLTLIERARGKLSVDWLSNVQACFAQFNSSSAELLSPGITQRRANEILQASNSSGYWSSFGSITGMIIARQIDQTLGRTALMETIALGPRDFFGKYIQMMRRDSSIPQLSDAVVRFVESSR